jgi:iron complex transport system permease protein
MMLQFQHTPFFRRSQLEVRVKSREKIIMSNKRKNNSFKKITLNVLFVLLLLIIYWVSLFIGRYPVDPFSVILILASKLLETLGNCINSLASAIGLHSSLAWSLTPTWDFAMETVVWQIRLPRLLGAVLVGAGLSVSGAAFQGTFRNPLVSESILGVSAGAGAGAAVAIILGQNSFIIQLFACLFGLLAVFLTFLVSRVYKSNPTLILVLSGVVIGSLFGSLTSLLTYIADPQTQLPDIVFWLLGSLTKVKIENIYTAGPVILVGIAAIFAVRWRLNTLSMGDDEAKTLGLNTKVFRTFVLVCATIITAVAVSISGLIAWIGLLIPHLSRMIVGPDHKAVIPASMLIGASYLILIDTLCRTLIQAEIPLSIVTSMIGAPVFLYFLKKTKESW